jgi:hypothetical protein
MEQRSTQWLADREVLDLSNELDPNDRLVLTMTWLVEHSLIEALGWWEHTSDWDLEVTVIDTSDKVRSFFGTPEYHLVIDGTKYEPWELLKDPSVPPLHDPDYIPTAWLHITDAEDNEGYKASFHIELDRVQKLIHGR